MVHQTNTNQSNIVVVDDTPEHLKMLSHILTQHGYLICPATSGKAALKAVRTTPPDLILLDILMPDMDGYEVCRQLKADERTHDIPVLFISALDRMMDKVNAFNVGGVDYITKPFQVEEVLARVETHLSLRNAQKCLQKKNLQLQRELDERKQIQEALQQRNRELSLLTRVSQMFSSSLELEHVLDTVLGEIQRLLDVVSSSFWLIEPETGELVCLQANGLGSDNIVHWRLNMGQGITGWAAKHNESVIVPDTSEDARHFKDVDKQTGLIVRSMISIPLRAKGNVIGVLNLVDPRVSHFTPDDLTLLEPIAAAVATAIENARLYTTAQQQIAERERAEEALQVSQQYAKNIIDSSLDMIIAADAERKIIEFNKAAQKTFGYPSEEVLGKHISILYADPEETSTTIHQHTVNKGQYIGEIFNRRKNGEVFPCLLSASILYDTHGDPIGSMGISRDITERKRAEQVQASLYLISEATQTTRHLDDLFPVIRDIVGKLMPVENFYIAFYDAATETISFPYYVKDNVPVKRAPRKFGSGLAEYVLREGQSLLLTPELREEFVKRGEMKPVSFKPTVVYWLGVPLKANNRIMGILTVQSHSKEIRLREEEKQILMFVSTQIAVAIERKRVEELLYRLETAIETTEVGITITDNEGRIVYTNPADAAMHGYMGDELIGQHSNIFTLPELRGKKTSPFQDGEEISNWKRERINVRKDGSVFPVKLISNPIYTKEGELVGKVTICEDITERKQAEKLLRESEEQYRSIFENATAGIFQATLDGKFIAANPALARMLGYASVRELIETVANIAEQLYVEPHHWYEIADMIQVTQETANVETRYRHKDGGELIVYLNIWTVPDEHGKARYFEGFIENITERKQMEKTLFRQATLLRSVAGAMTCLLVNADFQSAITQALELLGFATEVDRVSIFENHPHPETGEILMSKRFEWAKNGSNAQKNTPELQNLPYYPQYSRWYETLSAKKAIRGLVRQFPPSEQAILNAQHILSLIIVPIMIRDHFWGFIGFDDCYTERQWKEEEESILGAMAGSIGGAIARQQAETELIATNTELSETLENLKRTQTQLVQSEKMAALGQLIAGVAHEINTPLGAIQSAIGDISTTLNQTLEQLPAFFHSLSEEYREAFFALLQRALHKDITLSSREERKLKRALVKRLKERDLDNAWKIGGMLADMGVYDNIQPFVSLLNAPDHSRILNMAYRLSGLQESTHTITTAVDRASKVVFALRAYARHDYSGEMVKGDLTEGIETVLTLYYNKLKHGVEVIRNYEELPLILCYPDELNQVWTNLIHNALQAMEYKGILTIDVKKKEDRAIVSITDTGKGISKELKDKIFEPFFTTKPTGEGSGLGLDIVKKIIDKHQGDIKVESQPGKTTFHVLLPIKRDT